MPQEPISTTMGPMTAFLVEIRCTHSRQQRLGAPIIEEAERRPFGIEVNVGMSPRIGSVGSVPVVSEGYVIFSCKPRP
jgi:hypothetical protein